MPGATPTNPAPRAPGRFGEWYLSHEIIALTVFAAVTYTIAGMLWKVLLNWIVGPAWPVVFVWFGPILVRRWTRWEAALP